MVSGNRKVTTSTDSTEIVDLDKEEMIHIDNVKKTYSVVTFAQMRQAMQNMPAAINQASQQAQEQAPQQKPNIKTTFDVKVNNTGVQKEVNGLMAQEQIITLTMTVTNLDAQNGAAGTANAAAAPTNGSAAPAAQSAPNSQTGPASMTYVVTTDAWISPDPPEVKEIEDFDVRMAKKMMEGVDMQAWMAQMKSSFNSSGMNQMLSSQPGASDAMVQMGKELAKIKGTHVMDIVSMGGVVPAGTVTQGSTATTNQSSPTAGGVAGDAAAAGAASEAGRLGTLGSALGGSMLGSWHKKKASAPPPDTQQTAAATPSITTNPDGTQTVVLMATTTQKANFSQSAVAGSAFEIPAGYTQVASAMQQMGQPTAPAH
jgi:hypothetical protein